MKITKSILKKIISEQIKNDSFWKPTDKQVSQLADDLKKYVASSKFKPELMMINAFGNKWGILFGNVQDSESTLNIDLIRTLTLIPTKPTDNGRIKFSNVKVGKFLKNKPIIWDSKYELTN